MIDVYNPYAFGYPQPLQPPAQTPTGTYYSNSQIVQVAGKASVDMIRLEPYKGLLALDTTAPLLWVCTADGVGHVTATAFDITPHVDEPHGDNTQALEQRISTIEGTIKGLEERINGTYQPGTTGREPKHSSPAQLIDAGDEVSKGSDGMVTNGVHDKPGTAALGAGY